MAECVIFGAGKIARGFLAHLIQLSGHHISFVEKFPEIVDLLNNRGQYEINILGAPEKNCVIRNFSAVCSDDREAVCALVEKADIIFTAMGGKNLAAAAPVLTAGLHRRFAAPAARPCTIVTCENWKGPAALLRGAILENAAAEDVPLLDALLGVTEAVIMRSAIEPTKEQLAKDPLVVNAQDFWDLPVDKAGVAGPLPSIKHMRLIDNFGGFLDKKFYTYNAANGTVSFLGNLLGYTYISDAARDPFILETLGQVYSETASALSKKLGLPLEDLAAFDKTSLAKLQDTNIVDYVERNARDPLRKLGPQDRLIGPAKMCEAFGSVPNGLATAAAAAVHYKNPADPSATELEAMLLAHGTPYVLQQVCKLNVADTLFGLILEKEKELCEKGYLPQK
ncbi:MAG: hypothetical protein ACK5L3_10855 [Oscillospiraceae bacterium]